MRFSLFLFLILPLSSFARDWDIQFLGLTPQNTENLEISNKTVIKDQPAIRDQDGLGTCYAMAATTLFDQYCMTDGNCGHNKEAYIAALHILSNAGKANGLTNSISGGHTIETLKIIQEKILKDQNFKFIAESCAPYEAIEEDENELEAQWYTEGTKKLESLREIYNSVRQGEDLSSCDQEYFRRNYQSQVTNAELLELYRKTIGFSFNTFLETILIPKKCKEQSGHSVPLFSIGQFPSNSKLYNYKTEDIRNVLINKFNENKMVSVSLCVDHRSCLKEVEDIEDCPQNFQTRNCGPHALNLAGARKVCKTPTICSYQYKIHNSWGEDHQKSHDDGWVNEDSLFEGMKKLTGAKITWIDKHIPGEIDRNNEGAQFWECSKKNYGSFTQNVTEKREYELKGYFCKEKKRR